MNTEDNPAYCSYIFKNIYIEKYPGNQAKVSACCVNTSDHPKSYINFESDPYLQEQRQRIGQGEKIKSCDYCWRQESQGTHSLRRMSNEYITSPDPYKIELLGIDYNVEPICNAKCIMCDSYFSSAWAAENRKHGLPVGLRDFGTIHRSNATLDLDLSRLERIYFNGGEPLLSEEMPNMLRRISETQGGLKKVHVSLNTNGSIKPSQEILDLWRQINSLTINFSIDATDIAFEYIRNPLVWKDVVENLKELASNSVISNHHGYRVDIGCTVGVHNILEVADLRIWFDQLKQDLPFLHTLSVHPCQGVLGFDYVSQKLAHELSQQLEDHPMDDRMRAWLQSSDKLDDSAWIQHLESLDRRRDLDWRQSLPRLASMISKI